MLGLKPLTFAARPLRPGLVWLFPAKGHSRTAARPSRVQWCDKPRAFASTDTPSANPAKSPRSRWSEAEKDLLVQSHREGRSYKETCKDVLPHRTHDAILTMAKRMHGKTHLKKTRWTATDTARLVKLRNAGKFIKEIQRDHFPERSEKAVLQKVERLHAKHAKHARADMAITHRRWKYLTEAEEQTLRALQANGSTTEQIALKLGRRYNTIRDALARLNLAPTYDVRKDVQRLKWTQEEDAIVESFLSENFQTAYPHLRKHFPARTEPSLRRRLVVLRKRKGVERQYSRWTNEEYRKLDALAPLDEMQPKIGEIAQMLNRTVAAIRSKLYASDWARLRRRRARDPTVTDTTSTKAKDDRG